MFQGHALQELHGNECQPILLADVINRTDVGVIQGGRGLRFAAETRQRLRVSGEVFGQEFESNEAVQAGILSLVDHTHPPGTQPLDDAVVRNGLADEL